MPSPTPSTPSTISKPGKHVHFEDDSDVSASSSGSTCSPYGPIPPPCYGLRNVPLPEVTPVQQYAQLFPPPSPRHSSQGSPVPKDEQVLLNPSLAVRPGGLPPLLRWNVAQDHKEAGLRKETLGEPATSPPQSELIIRITRLHYPWTMTVKSRSSSYVTVDDVFHYIYRDLRSFVPPEQWKLLSRDACRDITVAWDARLHRFPETNPRMRGVRRVDYLRDFRVFRGLSVVNTAHVDQEQGTGPVLDLLLGRLP